jgi:hypothetical protein
MTGLEKRQIDNKLIRFKTITDGTKSSLWHSVQISDKSGLRILELDKVMRWWSNQSCWWNASKLNDISSKILTWMQLKTKGTDDAIWRQNLNVNHKLLKWLGKSGDLQNSERRRCEYRGISRRKCQNDEHSDMVRSPLMEDLAEIMWIPFA